MYRSLALDFYLTVVLVRVVVIKVVVVFLGMIWAPYRQRDWSIWRHAVFFPVIARPGWATVEGVQAALTPQQARSGRSSVRVIFRALWFVGRQSHLREFARVYLTEEFLVCPASRAAIVECVLVDALTLFDMAWRRSTAIRTVLYSDARRRSLLLLLLGVAIILLETASRRLWRGRRATTEVVEPISVPSLRSLGRRIVTVSQVVGRLTVATSEARHGGGVVRWKGSAEVGVSIMVNSAYTSLWRMISDVGCCEMQMS
jgi:hypothetical protein